jgi:hypothetical protein
MDGFKSAPPVHRSSCIVLRSLGLRAFGRTVILKAWMREMDATGSVTSCGVTLSGEGVDLF